MPHSTVRVSDNSECSPHLLSTHARNPPSSMPKEWPVRAPTEDDSWIVRLWLGVRSMMFQFLCLSAFGLPEIQAVHNKMQDQWDEFRGNTKEMLNQASIIGGLLLTATAVFLTTSPPLVFSSSPIIAYTAVGPYFGLLLSFAVSLGGVIVSSGLRFLIGNCERTWFYETAAKTHLRLCLTMYLAAYPQFSLGISTVVCAMSLIVAAWLSDHALVKVGCVCVFLAPSMLVPWILYLWFMTKYDRIHAAAKRLPK